MIIAYSVTKEEKIKNLTVQVVEMLNKEQKSHTKKDKKEIQDLAKQIATAAYENISEIGQTKSDDPAIQQAVQEIIKNEYHNTLECARGLVHGLNYINRYSWMKAADFVGFLSKKSAYISGTAVSAMTAYYWYSYYKKWGINTAAKASVAWMKPLVMGIGGIAGGIAGGVAGAAAGPAGVAVGAAGAAGPGFAVGNYVGNLIEDAAVTATAYGGDVVADAAENAFWANWIPYAFHQITGIKRTHFHYMM